MHRLSSISSCVLGNILEWYDFGLFTIFSSLFSRNFFPTENPTTALLSTFTIFAIGFLCRPIGALIFGFLGDRKGRARTLRLSILMISLPTLLIGFIPTYNQIGIFAPILLMLTRVWQGISIGGEYSGNLIYLAETAPNKWRATFTSLASTGANIGVLLAAFIGFISTMFFSTATLEAWGWRLPYLLSGALCLAIYSFRLRIDETDVFVKLKARHQLVRNPIGYVFQHNLPQLLRTLGLVCMGSTFYYFCFIYLPLYLSRHLHFNLQQISTLMMTYIGIMVILVSLAGYLCDQVGRRKMLLFNAAFVAVVTIPGFYLFQSHLYILIIVTFLIFTLASSLEQGTTCISVVENYPPKARYTGLSLAYNIGNGFLGGTVPIVCEWLLSTTHIVLSPAYYIVACAIITGLVAYFFVPETKKINLLENIH